MPLWEHAENVNGGKWTMSFPRRDEHGLHKLSKLFGAILSESMTEAKDVTGFVLSIKNWGCRLSMWVRDVPNDKCRSTGIDRLCKLMRPKFVSFYSHSDLGERRADTRKQLPVPIESPIQIIQPTEAAPVDEVAPAAAAAAAVELEAEVAAKSTASAVPKKSILGAVPAELLPASRKGAQDSQWNYGARDLMGLWVEKSAIESSHGGDEDSFEVELCSNEVQYTPFLAFAPRCATHFNLGQTATAFQLAGCC